MSPESAHQARHTVRELLTTWHVADAHVRYDVLLLTSELVTNAVRHGTDRVTLHLSLDENMVEVAVEDGSPVLPEPRLHTVEDDEATAGREGGRGVMIIDAVAESWGVDELPDRGKRVWARVSLARDVPSQRQP